MARKIPLSKLKKEIKKNFQDKVQKAINKTSFKKRMAKLAIDTIYKRVKSGYGVKSDTDPKTALKKLKKLSPLYKKFRKDVKLGKHGGKNFSNLTLSGQMLDAFGWTLKLNGFKIIIKKSKRKAVKDFFTFISPEAASTLPKKKLDNAQVAEYVSKSRPFLNLARSEQKTLKAEYERLVRAIARKF